MKKILLLIFILPLLSFQGLHKFYVSVTDINYNSESQSLQLISRIFVDDMENLLKTRYGEELYLTAQEEHPQVDLYLERYLSEKFRIRVNGKEFPLIFLGKEYDNDLLKLYIEIEQVEVPQQIEVTNAMLTELFPDQKNVVHVKLMGKTKSLLLGRGRESGVLNFSK